jgi:hypothetical protein
VDVEGETYDRAELGKLKVELMVEYEMDMLKEDFYG